MSKRRAAGRSPQIYRLFRQQNGVCYLCKKPMTLALECRNTATVDHKIPKSRLHHFGYIDYRNNVAAACLDCNGHKGSLTETEYLALLNGMAALEKLVDREYPGEAQTQQADTLAQALDGE